MAWRWQVIFLFLALLLASRAAAQSSVFSAVPSCALPCVTTAFIAGNCSSTNLTVAEECICTSDPLMSNMSTCAQTSCNFKDQVTSGNLLMAVCAAFPKQSRVYEMRATAIAALTISTVVVLARCAARLHLTGKLWSDDWTALLAAGLLLAGAGLELASTQLGFGMHFWDVRVDKASLLLQIFYAVEILYTWVKLIAKISIILLYMRVFTGKRFRWSCYACLCYCGISLTAFTFVIAFQCNPVESIWNRFISGQCLDVNVIGYTGAVLSIVEDIVLMVLPIPELRKLKISGRKRLGVSLMFVLASFAAITSMVRLKYLVQFSTTYDTTYDNIDAIVWSTIELTCIVVCGSLPPLRPYLGKIFPDLTTIKSSMRRAKSSGNESRKTGADGMELPGISNPSGQRSSRRLGSLSGFTELRDPTYLEYDGRPLKSVVYQYHPGRRDA